jgi:site-specific DNA-methyltransferase (adenine-specific)
VVPLPAKGKKRGRFRNGKPVLALDEDTEKGIVAAYKATCKGYSTDLILCDPELNEKFTQACKRKSLPGDAYTWNKFLLRIRKAGKLPRSGQTRKRLAVAAMDAFSAASEAAMQLLTLEYGLALDDILCSPQWAAEFDQMAAEFAGGFSPYEYRWAAMTIRKRAKKSRKTANERSEQWKVVKLSRQIPLARCASDEYAIPAVYVVVDHGGPLYVGQTLSLKARVQQILDTQSWMRFGPKSLKLIDPKSAQLVDTGDKQVRHGLQSHLIGRTNPLLNSVLLRPDYEA